MTSHQERRQISVSGLQIGDGHLHFNLLQLRSVRVPDLAGIFVTDITFRADNNSSQSLRGRKGGRRMKKATERRG